MRSLSPSAAPPTPLQPAITSGSLREGEVDSGGQIERRPGSPQRCRMLAAQPRVECDAGSLELDLRLGVPVISGLDERLGGAQEQRSLLCVAVARFDGGEAVEAPD